MADSTYMPKVYHERPGDRLVGVDGGEIRIESGCNFFCDPGSNVSFPNPYGGLDYFVDGNASGVTIASGLRPTFDATRGGLSWGDCFSMLSSAIAASNTSIGLTANRWWARRNRIFCCGDRELTEDLTVLPEKCDIIGVGYDAAVPYPIITGTHVIAAATNGVRFINLGFYDDTGTLDMSLEGVGNAFYGCTFHPNTLGTTMSLALTGAAGLKIQNCTWLMGDISNVFGTCISLLGASGLDQDISHNRIAGTVGILTNVSLANTVHGSQIANNHFRTTGYCVNDASADYMLVNNIFISDAADDASGAGGAALVVKCNIRYAAGNRMTNDVDNNCSYPDDSEWA